MTDFPKTVEDISEDFVKRRSGLLRALTEEVDDFYQQCDPERDNLCLYGHADGNWAVDLPVEEVPPELPEPCLGINFARDGMQKKDWLALVAIHSDSWLMSVSFFYAVKLDSQGRAKLFKNINQHPTLFEVVTGRAGKPRTLVGPPPAKRAKQEDQPVRASTASNLTTRDANPQPTGHFLRMEDITPALKGRRAELFWPDNKLWYVVTILQINNRNRQAKIVYNTGEEEELDLTEVIEEKHMTLLPM